MVLRANGGLESHRRASAEKPRSTAGEGLKAITEDPGSQMQPHRRPTFQLATSGDNTILSHEDFLVEAAALNPEIVRAEEHSPQHKLHFLQVPLHNSHLTSL